MESSIAHRVPKDNGQEQITLVIHGPSWTNTMPLDAHAITVVLPQLLHAGWQITADDRRPNRIDVVSPWAPEVLQ